MSFKKCYSVKEIVVKVVKVILVKIKIELSKSATIV